MRRETPEEKVRREQRELIARLNAARDARLTTRQQNDMRMRGAPPPPPAEPVPQGAGSGYVRLGGMAGRAQSAMANRLGQIDTYVDRAVNSRSKPR